MKVSFSRISTFIVFICIIPVSYSFSSADVNQKLKKTSSQKKFSKFNINNISTYIYNDGDADIQPTGNSGLEYPKGSKKAVVYESGFVWGGKKNGKVLVGGSTYSQGLSPGKILADGTADDPNSDETRVFRVRPDYKTADLSSEIEDEQKSAGEIFSAYEKDWLEWPAEDGAPYWDKNENGIYEPSVDIPGIIGADQTLWFVANDLDSNQAKKLYGSPTMGIELQVTVWGYQGIEVLNNMFFKRFILINKSTNDFEETYVSVWSDPDVGDAGDDYAGCDTTLSLGYVYNGNDNDMIYGSNVPAVGLKFIQGPIVKGEPQEKGKFKSRLLNGMKNLPMTSFSFFIGSDPVYNDPDLGEYITGTLQCYNLMKGLIPTTGTPFINPITNQNEIYTLSGDPITKDGWIDGILHPPGDRRILLNSGPFTLAAGDTQEVIIAEIAAGGEKNIDRLQAIKLLKLYNGIAQEFYNYNFAFSPPYKLSPPKVEAGELDKEIILSWDNDKNLSLIENSAQFGYNFQGYTIYQYPNGNFNKYEAKEVNNFDINDGRAKIISESIDFSDQSKLFEVVKNGTDSGIQRHISIKNDLFNAGNPLINGKNYYFSVSAYSLNSNPIFYPVLIESEPFTLTVLPQSPKPGNFYEGRYGDEIDVTQINGQSNFQINITVIDPTKLKGMEYHITFYKNIGESDSNWRNLKLTLIDEENNILINQGQIIIQDKLLSVKPFSADGFEIEPFSINSLQSFQIADEDEFLFTTPKTIINNDELAKKQVDLINVFPNPYYGRHNNEKNQYEKYVTFNHLPRKTKIKIFNLGGQLVHKIEKNDESQYVRWDLTNGNNFWVPSGIYIVYIEMPDLNKTKILKLAVIMETIIPDYF